MCRWWDRECAGYLRAEDAEEILLYTSDFISRARPAPVPARLTVAFMLALWQPA